MRAFRANVAHHKIKRSKDRWIKGVPSAWSVACVF